MSAHFSKFLLNTYSWSPYFEAHIPADYPISPVLQKYRAFRRLPPRLQRLSRLAKRWARRNYPDTNFVDIDRWYDDEGYELNPDTGDRLTDEEIDAEWDALEANWGKPDIEVEDIPLPAGGFADPDTWEEPPKPEEISVCDREGLTEAQVLSDIASRGRRRTAAEYGVPVGWLSQVKTDADLARMVLDMHGKPWPTSGANGQTLSTDAAGHEHAPKGPPVKPTGVPRLPLPQARILQALLPVAGAKTSMSRAGLCKKVGYTAISGTITRALNGIREGSESGTPHKGLLDSGLVTKVKGEGNVTVYQITAEGISAIEDYLKKHGELPKPRDKTLSTNIRRRRIMTDTNDPNIVGDPHDLNRFMQAQVGVYDRALSEIRSGRKCSHWIWFIFPQVDRLGSSSTSKNYKLYAIKSIAEAKAYLSHPVLGPRLMECAEAALSVQGRTAHEIFGSPDDKKLRFCATLFASVSQPGSAFDRLLDKYYQGERDSKTLRLLGIASDMK